MREMREWLLARWHRIPLERRGQLVIGGSILTHMVMASLYLFQVLFRGSWYYLALAIWYVVLILERMFYLHLSRKPVEGQITLRDRVIHLLFGVLQAVTLSSLAIAMLFFELTVTPKRFLFYLNLIQLLLKLLLTFLPTAPDIPEWGRWNRQTARFEHGMLYLIVFTQLIYTYAWGKGFVYLVRGLFVLTLLLSLTLLVISFLTFRSYRKGQREASN